jgi:hypothetical protein
MKTSLYLENVDSFGDWRILVSTRAEGHLRQARRASAGMFKVYVKKIRCAFGVRPQADSPLMS